jgi:hypothetical protein
MGNLKEKCMKQITTLWKNLQNICHEISTITGEKFQRFNNKQFHKYVECVQSQGRHFQRLL